MSADSVDYALLLLLLGNTSEYRQFCQDLISLPDEPQNALSAECFAQAFAAGPVGTVDPVRLVQWAEQGCDGDKRPRETHVLVLAHYRAGHLDQAIQLLRIE